MSIRMKHWRLFLFINTLLLMMGSPLFGQFYRGSQMDFGKNRVQFDETIWTHFRFPKFDIYLYLNGRPIGEYVARYAHAKIPEMERLVDVKVEKKIQFIVFNRLSDLMESNIGLISNQNYNVGGITHIVGSRVFLYFNGDYADLDKQIDAGIAQIITRQVFTGQSVTNILVNNALVDIPQWYENGLVAFLSEGWSVETDNYFRDAFLNKKFKRFNALAGEEARLAGQSIWYFISERYGPNAIANILFMAKASRSIEHGFLYVLGISFKELMFQWREFYNERFILVEQNQLSFNSSGVFKTTKNKAVLTQARISPDGNQIAYILNDIGKVKVYLHNYKNGKTKRIFKKGHKLDEKTDYSQPIIAWHPSGLFLTMISEEKGGIWIYYYWLDTKKFEKTELFSFDKILDFSYSPDGQNMLFSAVLNGMTNLYLFSPGANSYEALTSDGYTDLYPRFINSGKQIIFSSNRLNDTLFPYQKEVPVEKNKGLNLFVYDFNSRSPVLKRVTHSSHSRNIMAIETPQKEICYLGDENGIMNRYIVSVDSMISRVDTLTHYRYIYKSKAVTNYKRNIAFQDIAKNKYAEIVYLNGKYQLRVDNWDQGTINQETSPFPTYYSQNRTINKERKSQIKENISQPTRRKRLVAFPGLLDDTISQIDVTNYVIGDTPPTDTIKKKQQEEQAFTIPILRNYDVEFAVTDLVNQLDFSFLSESYQKFQGGKSPIFINPDLNAFFKVGVMDLLEDYRITGGVKISSSFVNNEYLISFENLRKRLDKQWIFYRGGTDYIDETSYTYTRVKTHEGRFILKYPFSRVLAVKGGLSLRSDKAVFLSTDLQNLQQKNSYDFWAGAKAEIIFDNTRSPALNIFFGTRWKVFIENYRQVDNLKQDLWVLGMDYRHYMPIHRNFIWANRFAYSTSFGKQLLIYYLGGVDSWLTPKFNTDINVDPNKNYAYQTVATNMRGFTQNIRNGNSFFVLNSELRFPVFSYLLNRPINNQFVKNFQIITFADLGSAWTGLQPFSKDNSFFTTEIHEPGSPVSITVVSQRNPIVFGFGTGVRTSLLGYMVKADVAWGIDDGIIMPRVFYISLSMDF